ncbi:hypothetical protein B7O87_09275 [Cylindrospermopsis raciborskii CENA303]|uniref:O-antigen ligase-related domain-containing protein n=1 Tax=Cylindrospermopsis raciborskii CENA303 TaxID=1170769 RepID=A0A1X4G6U4_9CYAN|nr:O-antigen ligase family protein [Cylindrospermopsis raciborskii]OSO90601.1 hypothetical protein B7O87_09275 [Cylindrospermopsis raciborskii CENA303]
MSYVSNVVTTTRTYNPISITYRIYPALFDFINDRFVSLIFSDRLGDQLTNADTSEGARIAIWSLAFDFVLQNPFTGSGFLGVWVLSDWSGSAHNEFVDRLTRLGLFGFLLYLLLLWKIFESLLKTYPLLALGFLSILIYSFFHETFSQSQAAVLFSLLMAFYSNRRAVHWIMIGDNK